MFCPTCGTKNPDGSKFCAGCGSALSAPIPANQQPLDPVYASASQEPQFQQPPVQPTAYNQPAPNAPVENASKEKTDIKASILSALKDLLRVVSPLVNKVKPIVMKNKWLSIGIAALVAVLLIGGIVWGILGTGSDYILAEHDIVVVDNGETLVVVWDDEVFDTKIEATEHRYTTNLDQSCVAIMTKDWDLYVFDGDELTRIAGDVKYYTISTTGEGIVYVMVDGSEESLYLYDVGDDESHLIADASYFAGYEISPDGQSVVYSVPNDGEYKVMYYTDGESMRIASGDNYFPLAVSDDGEQIYVGVGNNITTYELYCYNADGDKTKLSEDVSSVSFNYDFTQVLFYKERKTYISTEGEDPVKISGNIINPLMPTQARAASISTSYSSRVYPVEDLYEKIYTGVDSNGNRSAWVIQEDVDESIKLVSNISDPILDPSGEYLYYLDRNNDLMVLEIADGDNASDKAIMLAADVDGYAVTSDRSLVYYMSDDFIYSVNGENGRRRQTVCTEDVDDAGLNADDVFFYLVDGDVYATDNGKRGSRVMSDIDGLQQGIYCVYAYTSDELFISTDSDEFEKIMTRN